MPKAVIVLSLILVAWLGGGTWWWVCKHRGLCGDPSSSSIAATARPSSDTAQPMTTGASMKKMPFLVNYQGKPWFQTSDYLRFGKSSAAGFIPGSVKSSLDSLASFLRNNPDKDLEITGSYAESESNSSKSPNLGLGRADFFLQQLLTRGVGAEQLIQLPKQISAQEYFGEGDTLFGGIDLRLLDKNGGQMADAGEANAANATTPETGAASERRASPQEEAEKTSKEAETPAVSFQPRNFLFGMAKSDLVLSQEDRNYITGVIQYLRQNPSKKLLLTGHADNSGTPENNMEYGRNRANTVKQFFTSFGLNSAQIQTDSKGDRAPAQSNATAEGRRQNRRVEIRVSN